MKGTNPNLPACTLDNDLESGLDLATYQLSTRANKIKIGQVKLNESSHAVKLSLQCLNKSYGLKTQAQSRHSLESMHQTHSEYNPKFG